MATPQAINYCPRGYDECWQGCAYPGRCHLIAELAPLPCRHCGFVGRGHIHSLVPIIGAAFIAKYPCNMNRLYCGCPLDSNCDGYHAA